MKKQVLLCVENPENIDKTLTKRSSDDDVSFCLWLAAYTLTFLCEIFQELSESIVTNKFLFSWLRQEGGGSRPLFLDFEPSPDGLKNYFGCRHAGIKMIGMTALVAYSPDPPLFLSYVTASLLHSTRARV